MTERTDKLQKTFQSKKYESLYVIKESKSFELEATFKSHLVQIPCNKQGCPQLDQFAQSPVHSELECLQRQGTHLCLSTFTEALLSAG